MDSLLHFICKYLFIDVIIMLDFLLQDMYIETGRNRNMYILRFIL